LRSGVIPILLAAALRAFPSALSITRSDGTYVGDILPSTIEDICSNPSTYYVTVVGLDDSQREYLDSIYRIFAPDRKISQKETDPLRRCYDALIRWRESLPQASFTALIPTNQTSKFQKLVLYEQDPYILFFQKFPLELGVSIAKRQVLLTKIRQSKKELEGVVTAYYTAAKRSILSALQLESKDGESVTRIIKNWTECFPADFDEHLVDGISKSFLSRCRMPYEDDDSLIDSLCSLTIGKSVARWDDSSIALFDREVHALVNRIEDTLFSENYSMQLKNGSSMVARLAATRFKNMYGRLARLLGSDEAKKVVEQVLR